MFLREYNLKYLENPKSETFLFDPIKLIFWTNVLSGVLAPILVIYIFVIGNNSKIMQKHHLGLITNIGLVMTALVMIKAILLFYGLATG